MAQEHLLRRGQQLRRAGRGTERDQRQGQQTARTQTDLRGAPVPGVPHGSQASLTATANPPSAPVSRSPSHRGRRRRHGRSTAPDQASIARRGLVPSSARDGRSTSDGPILGLVPPPPPGRPIRRSRRTTRPGRPRVPQGGRLGYRSTVGRGESVGIGGPSGSGESTMLDLVGSLTGRRRRGAHRRARRPRAVGPGTVRPAGELGRIRVPAVHPTTGVSTVDGGSQSGEAVVRTPHKAGFTRDRG
jgi:hypothetical protein